VLARIDIRGPASAAERRQPLWAFAFRLCHHPLPLCPGSGLPNFIQQADIVTIQAIHSVRHLRLNSYFSEFIERGSIPVIACAI
jgi:hypothetical protein